MSDAKAGPRIRNPELLRHLHYRWRYCVLCDGAETEALSLHHVHRHPRDDVEANLVMVCGSGTTGCHGRIEANDRETLRALAGYLRDSRPDVLLYLAKKLSRSGGMIAAVAWLARLEGGKTDG